MTGFYTNVSRYYGIYLVLAAIWYILLAIGLWKTFKKAGEAGWKAIIPIYNFYILFKISWNGRMFWALFAVSVLSSLLIGYGSGNSMMFYLGMALNIVAALIQAVLWYNVSLAYGHGLGYFLGLYFLNPIFIMILGYGKSQYIGNRYNTRV